MAQAFLIVIGSSAGGIEALLTLVSGLPAVLTRQGTLPAAFPADGAALLGGAIYLAPPAHDLTVSGMHIAVTPIRRVRPCPSVDRLFASAARSYGSRAIGVILSGNLSDGTRGWQAVKQAGGTTIIQNPLEAAYPSMPQSAQDQCAIDYCLALTQIAPLLQQLAG
jgi:two-component system chemotaxis response regulator CheB